MLEAKKVRALGVGALGARALGPSWVCSLSVAGAGLPGRTVGARVQVPPPQWGSVRAIFFNFLFLLNSLEGHWLMAHICVR